ncbi:MAG: PH domain-containing protein [Clostridia bacterium]|nr:PH domain-containing protein [Clostridia bacterium]
MNNTKTTYKLNRFFYIVFNPSMNKWLIIVNLIMIAWIVFSNKNSLYTALFCSIAVDVILVLDLFFHSPKFFVTDGEEIKFNEYAHIKPESSPFVITKGGFFWLKVSYSISNIQDIKYHQNFIEKIFDIGHISFSGKADFSAKRDMDRIKRKEQFTIYGIKHFSNFKGQL